MRPAGTQELLRFFFRASGRIGRMEYVLGTVFIYALNGAVLFHAMGHTDFDAAAPFVMAIAGLPSTVAFLVLMAKRGHDLALPGSFVLLVAVPAVGLFWAAALMFIPGNAGPNLYGPPPRFGPD